MGLRVLVVGAGGVGGFIGGKLAATEQVTFLCREGEHLSALQANGLEVTDTVGAEADEGTVTTIPPPQATFTSLLDGAELFDVVMVTTKLADFGSAMISSIKSVIRDDSVVFSLQNGIEATLQLAAELGERVLAAQCYLISFKVGPGKIKCMARQPKPIMFGERRASSAFAEAGGCSATPRCKALSEAFERNGLPVDVPVDADLTMWKKFVLSSVYPFLALGRLPFAVGFGVPETRGVLVAAMEETMSVARGYGVELDGTVEEFAERLQRIPKSSTCSTMRDVVDGKPSEADGLSGAVVRLGQALLPPVATPSHALVLALLLPGEKRARGEIDY